MKLKKIVTEKTMTNKLKIINTIYLKITCSLNFNVSFIIFLE